MNPDKFLLYAVSYETAKKFFSTYMPKEGEVWEFPEFTVEIVEVERTSWESWGEQSDVRVVMRAVYKDGTHGYFLRTGTQDSYGDFSWDSKVLPVKPVSKLVFEYTDIEN